MNSKYLIPVISLTENNFVSMFVIRIKGLVRVLFCGVDVCD